MKRLLTSPDNVVTLLALLAFASIAIWVLWPTPPAAGQETGWGEFFLKVFAVLIPGAFPVVWRTDNPFRLWLHGQWSKVFGPNAEFRVDGSIPLPFDRNGESAVVLDQVWQASRVWRKDADRQITLDRRIIIVAGARTIIASVSDHDTDEETGSPALRQLHLQLRGYQERLGRIGDRLNDEVLPLLNRVVNKVGRHESVPTFSLDVQIDGRNPYLGFYLRGIPSEKIEMFGIKFAEESHGEHADVTVTQNQVAVTSNGPAFLVSTARRHLGSPSLALGDAST